MKVLVTGGAGFIGSHLTQELLNQGCQVVVLDNLSTGCLEHVPAAAAFYEQDIRSDQVAAIFAREQVDAVVHLAAQTSVPESIADPGHDCDVNIQGTLNILKACQTHQVKRVVFASSAAVFGDAADLPLTEATMTQPTSYYGLSKLTVEHYLGLYYKHSGLTSAVLRFANVYGERQGDGGEGGVISIFVRKLFQNQDLTIYGDGDQTRDFIYVGDVVSAIAAALAAQIGHAVFNVSTNTQVSVNELVRLLALAAEKQTEVNYQPKREGDIYHSCLSNDKARDLLNWQPRMSLAEGLQRTYADLSIRAGGMK